MKKLLIPLLSLSLISCEQNPEIKSPVFTTHNNYNSTYTIVTIDSCEYILFDRGISHKGNCKYCKARR